jgi:hypothetical protein
VASYSKVYLDSFGAVASDPANTAGNTQGDWDSPNGNGCSPSPLKQGNANSSNATSITSNSNPRTRCLLEGTSPPMNAQTLSGTMQVCIGMHQSNADAHMALRVHLWVVTEGYQGGTTIGNSPQAPVDVIVGTLVDKYEDPDTNELPTTTTFVQASAAIPLTTLAVPQNSRLVWEIGVIVRSALGVARTVTVRRGTMTSSADTGTALADGAVGGTDTSTKAGWISFSNAIDFVDPPANDACAAAEVISALPFDSGYFTDFLAVLPEATDIKPSTASAGQGRWRTKWYEWTSPAGTGSVRLQMTDYPDGGVLTPAPNSLGTLANGYQQFVTVFTGSCGSLSEVAAGGIGSWLVFAYSASTTYKIQISSRQNSQGDWQRFKMRLVSAVANDNCANATVVSALPYALDDIDLTLATAEGGEPVSPDTFVGNAHTAWWKWEAPVGFADNLTIDLRSMNALTEMVSSAQLSVWSGVCGTMSHIISMPWTNFERDYYGVATQFIKNASLTFRPIAGTTYYIRISTTASNTSIAIVPDGTRGSGYVNLSITAVPIPSGESCAEAIEFLTVPSFFQASNENCASDDAPTSIAGQCAISFVPDPTGLDGRSLWFKWVADRSAPMTFSTYGSPTDGALGLFPVYASRFVNNCDPSSEVDCDFQNGCDGTSTELAFTSVLGTTYYFRIVPSGGVIGTYQVGLSTGTIATVTNGDLYVGNNAIYIYTPQGQVRICIEDSTGGLPTGAAFAGDLSFYVCLFAYDEVWYYDQTGTFVDFWSTSPGVAPETIVRDLAGNFVAGFSGDGYPDTPVTPESAYIRKYGPTGTLLGAYAADVENQGTGFLDLATDQDTVFYTSAGRHIKRYSLSGGQLADFATLPSDGGEAQGLRVLPDGGVIVADRINVKRLNSSGSVTQTYSITPLTTAVPYWYAIDLDGDGASFWVTEFNVAGTAYDTTISRVHLITEDVLTQFRGQPSPPGWLCGITCAPGTYRAGLAFGAFPPPYTRDEAIAAGTLAAHAIRWMRRVPAVRKNR